MMHGERPPVDPLVELLADLDEEAAVRRVRARIAAGDEPAAIIEDCQAGLALVGERYEAGEYFISGLVMAGEIFRRTMLLVEPLLRGREAPAPRARVLLCTVRGDIHALGKDLVGMLLVANGFAVHDLGVDVPAAEVAAAVRDEAPAIVGLSAMLVTAFASMRETVEAVRAVAAQTGRAVPIIVGGGQMNAEAARTIGADAWSASAADGVRQIRALVGLRAET